MTGEADPPGARPRAQGPWGPQLLFGLVLLTLAGFVDAVGLLGFGLFPSFLSGDTTQLGVAWTQHRDARAIVLGGAVVIFVAGAFLGRLLRLRTGRRSPVLLVEAVLLGLGVVAARFGAEGAALACAVLAMGAQTTVLTHAGDAPVGATYVTGTLARLGSGLADALAGGDRTGWLAYLMLWIALVTGAAGGALCYGRTGLDSLWLAAAAAAALAAGAWVVEGRQAPRNAA